MTRGGSEARNSREVRAITMTTTTAARSVFVMDRTVKGRTRSTVDVSSERRLKTRPLGVRSWKREGARNRLKTRAQYSFLEPMMQPMAVAKAQRISKKPKN